MEWVRHGTGEAKGWESNWTFNAGVVRRYSASPSVWKFPIFVKYCINTWKSLCHPVIQLFITFQSEKKCLSQSADPGGSIQLNCGEYVIWFKAKNLSLSSFHYCAVAVTGSGNLWWKKISVIMQKRVSVTDSVSWRLTLPRGRLAADPESHRAQWRGKGSLPSNCICLCTSMPISMCAYLSSAADAYTCPNTPSLAGKLCTKWSVSEVKAEDWRIDYRNRETNQLLCVSYPIAYYLCSSV